MRKLFFYLRDYKKETVLAPLFKLLEATLELFVPLVVAAVIDTGIAEGDFGYIRNMCLVLVLLGTVGLAFSVTAQYFAAKSAAGFTKKLREALFAHIQTFSYGELDTQGTSTLITRMTSDMNQVQAGLNLTLRLLLRSPFVIVGAMIMAFTIDVKAALVFAVGIPALAAVVFGIMLACIPLYRGVQGRLDRVLGLTRENLTGARVLRAFCREEEQRRIFREKNQELTALQKFTGRISALLNPVTYIIINLAIIVLIRTGAMRVETGILTQGAVVALYNYMAQILTELIKLANLILNITRAVACGNRIQAVLEVSPSIRDGDIVPRSGADAGAPGGIAYGSREAAGAPGRGVREGREDAGDVHGSSESGNDGISCGGVTGGNGFAAFAARSGERAFGEDAPAYAVEFRDVSLRYPRAAREALEKITLAVRPGETIGIIGGTGSGKTSLINLIPRFYDCTDGCVLVDGRDVREYALRDLRGRIGVVPQKAVLFRGTLRENLRWGNANATDGELMEALEIAQAAEFVRRKEEGLSAAVEQGGKNFSGGQRQRLTIARALVRKPEILILDDSSSALDMATDAALRRALAAMENRPALFVVSQRTAALQNADRILVLEDGEAVGLGTHSELLKTCSVYREIYESQYGGAAGM